MCVYIQASKRKAEYEKAHKLETELVKEAMDAFAVAESAGKDAKMAGDAAREAQVCVYLCMYVFMQLELVENGGKRSENGGKALSEDFVM